MDNWRNIAITLRTRLARGSQTLFIRRRRLADVELAVTPANIIAGRQLEQGTHPTRLWRTPNSAVWCCSALALDLDPNLDSESVGSLLRPVHLPPPSCIRDRVWRQLGCSRKVHRVQVAKDRRQERCIHRDADPSAGLHLFQELSTLGQQLAHALLFRGSFPHS